MIQIYKNLHKNTYEHEMAITDNNWIRITAPTAAEVLKVEKELKIPRFFIDEALDIHTRPMIDEAEDATYMIIHIPYIDPTISSNADGIRYRTLPLGIILKDSHWITICSVEAEVLANNFIKTCQGLGPHMQVQNTLDLLHHMAQRYLKLMQTMEFEITEAEKELSVSYRNTQLYTLLYLNDGLLDMTISLKQMLHLMRKIDQEQYLGMLPNGQELFEDTIIELEQAYSVAEINQLNCNNVMDAYGNIIQNNVSHVVKLLTALTIVLSIPTVIASIYGMNVPLPFQESEHAFSILMIIMIISTGVVAGFFYKKRFF